MRKDAAEASDGWLTGAAAVRMLLAQTPADRFPAAVANRRDTLIQDTILLTPTYLRPVVPLDSGDYATADVNDLYRRLINRANRLRKLAELNAPPVIIRNESRELQKDADALFANTSLPRPRQARGRPLVDLSASLARRLLEAESKRVEFSAGARAVVEPRLPADRVRVPKKIYDRLKLDRETPVLLTTPDGGAFAAAMPDVSDDNLLRLPGSVVQRIGLPATGAPSCDLHRPLGASAVRKAHRLLHEVAAVRSHLGHDPFIDADNHQDVFAGLIDAALSGREIRFDSPGGLLLAGTGALAFHEAAPRVPCDDDAYREIPESSE